MEDISGLRDSMLSVADQIAQHGLWYQEIKVKSIHLFIKLIDLIIYSFI